MSGATVPVPVAVLESLRGFLVTRSDSAVSCRSSYQTYATLLNEAISIAEEHAQPDVNELLVSELTPALAKSELARLDVEALLTDIVGTVGEYLNQCFVGDAAGTKAAMAALREAVRPLAKTVGDRDFVLAELCETMRRQDGVSWSPRHPDGKLFAAVATQTIPREGDRVMVDGQPYLCGHAEHDALSCVIPLRFCAGHHYPGVVESDESEEF